MSPARLLASWFGVGRARVAPGTWGTLAAVPLVLAAWLAGAPPWTLAVAALAVTAVGIPASAAAEREIGTTDPPEVVIDEVAGFLVAAAVATIPLARAPGPAWHWTTLVACVALFRLLDIWKPWPISRLQDLPGGWGVVCDDLAAGAAAGGILLALRALAPTMLLRALGG